MARVSDVLESELESNTNSEYSYKSPRAISIPSALASFHLTYCISGLLSSCIALCSAVGLQ